MAGGDFPKVGQNKNNLRNSNEGPILGLKFARIKQNRP
jgi:hypothetical protein